MQQPERVLISFLSDFGTVDEFVGVVHAVLTRHAPSASVVDITHGVAPHDIRAGAMTLWRSCPWLAPGVVLAVVDPGVGTSRRPVAVEVRGPAGRTVLVAPDNGLILPAANRLGRITAAVQLPPAADSAGATFDGRDVFAPAAGRAAAGVPVVELGREIDPSGLVGEPVPEPVSEGAGLRATILWIDHFGNAQLNVAAAQGRSVTHVSAGALDSSVRVVASYGAIAPDPVALVVDSYGMLAISCNRSSAAAAYGLAEGMEALLR